MKVILSEDVEKLGTMGDTVNVAPGYARNFLLPRKLAVPAESGSAKQIEHERKIIERREGKRREEFGAVRDTIDGIELKVTARAGEEGKLFGSITTAMIADKLGELGHEVDRKNLVLAEPIRVVGNHTVSYHLAKDIEASIKVTVEPIDEPAPEAAEEPATPPAQAPSESEGEGVSESEDGDE